MACPSPAIFCRPFAQLFEEQTRAPTKQMGHPWEPLLPRVETTVGIVALHLCVENSRPRVALRATLARIDSAFKRRV
jgi:hypothetical protein